MKNENQSRTGEKSITINFSGFTFSLTTLATVVLVVMKLTGAIDSWWIVAIPVLTSIALHVLGGILVLLMICIHAFTSPQR